MNDPHKQAPQKVNFTRRQCEYIDKMFSEMIGTATTTTEALRHNAGQRSVVKHIQSLQQD